MDFSHNLDHYSDTIVARATPLGSGGVAIIRLSGPQAVNIANLLVSKDLSNYENRKAYFTTFIDSQKALIDEGLVLVMQGPNSYTGEDVVELQCHGGMFVVEKILSTAVEFGARMATGGEFTKRAFLNGKIDLTKAEGICDMIAAKSKTSHEAAVNHLSGKLESTIHRLMDDLIDMAAHFEVSVDYPEEELEIDTKESMLILLKTKIGSIDNLLATFQSGHKAKTGTSVCLIGSPNVGKSSIMNTLLKQQRCIVTSTPGTTRDFIEEDFFIQGTHFHLKDTAGIRATRSNIEKEGIKASWQAISDTDIVIFVLDTTAPIHRTILDKLNKDKTVVVWNKIDLKEPQEKLNFPHIAHLSAKNGQGMHLLEEKLLNLAAQESKENKNAILITSSRHKKLLEEAKEDFLRVQEGLKQNLGFELLAFDMKSGLNHLSSIIGRNISEDILSSVFNNFCVGK